MLTAPFCQQMPVLSVDECTELLDILDQQPDDHFFYESTHRRRGLLKQMPEDYRYTIHWDSWFAVEFDDEGKISRERVTEVYQTYPRAERLNTIIHKTIEIMAKQLGWRNCTQAMGVTIMQNYKLRKGETALPIDWHPDLSTHTLVVLLDDETAWEGGDFRYRIGENEATRFHASQGKGVLFTNEGTKHKRDAFTAKVDGVSRTILTVHQNIDKLDEAPWSELSQTPKPGRTYGSDKQHTTNWNADNRPAL